MGDRAGEGRALGGLGDAFSSLDQSNEAIESLTKALNISRELGDRAGEGRAFGNLGMVYTGLGQYDEAIEFHTKAIHISHELGDKREEGKLLSFLGNALLVKSDGQASCTPCISTFLVR